MKIERVEALPATFPDLLGENPFGSPWWATASAGAG